MKKLSAACLAIILSACGGGSDTTSEGGGSTTVGSAPVSTESSAAVQTSSQSGSAESSSSGSGNTAAPMGSAGYDGTYRGQITVTLSGEGILPTSDSTDITIQVSGTRVTATAEGRSYQGNLNGNTFEVEIPIDETSRGITCKGTPKLRGTINGNSISGTVSGTGVCSSASARVPVSVQGNFSAKR